MNFSNFLDSMVKLLTRLKLFKTSGSNWLDLSTGVTIAILITLGKKPSLKESFKKAFKQGRSTVRSSCHHLWFLLLTGFITL